MNQGPVSVSCTQSITIPPYHCSSFKSFKTSKMLNALSFPRFCVRYPPICCTQINPWEPLPVMHAPIEEADDSFLMRTSNIAEILNPDSTTNAPETETGELTEVKNEAEVELQFLKWPMWVLGPSLLVTTGIAPTIWLPISAVFLGPNIASLLALIGLDCIYNLGATLFLLMADTCARPKHPIKAMSSEAPLTYRLWNMFANVFGFVIPLVVLYGSRKELVQPHLPLISFAVLLGPYLLLLSVQSLTEMLTWHWQSPIWLVTPIVYEGYRVLQLMRGLQLGAELNAPAWTIHTIRGLVFWWVLILAIQLMRVAWFAGLAWSHKQLV